MAERILCVVAHPDDETLMCGGTLAKHALNGDAISVFVLADGVLSRTGMDINAAKERHQMLRNACKILGTEDVWVRAYHDNKMDKYPLLQVIQDIETHVMRFKPTIIITHWYGDLNVDHEIVSRAVMTACRPLKGSPASSIHTILMGEAPSSTEWGQQCFHPKYFENISSTIEIKMEALECYPTEIPAFPHPRSMLAIRNLAEMRGSRVGLLAAEAFVVSRIIKP